MSLWIHFEIPSSNDCISFKEAIDIINESLLSAGLPTYDYNFGIDIHKIRLPEIDGSRSDLSQLKYVAAMLLENSKWIPDSNFKRFSSNHIPSYLKEKILIEDRSHLICNYHGKYIPIDFKEAYLPAGFIQSLGSSINLKKELEILAENLNLKLEKHTNDIDVTIDKIIEELGDDPLFMSKIMLLRLYNIVVISIRYNLIICMD
jgi:hypothetical protein